MGCCCAYCDDPKWQKIHRWILFALNILVWIFSVSTLASCTFVQYNYRFYSAYGVFGRKSRSSGNCFSYTDPESSTRAAQAFGIIANLSLVFAFVGLCLIMFVLKDRPARMLWMGSRILYIVALIGVLVTFSIVGRVDCTNVYDCALGAAGVLNTLNIWILIGMISVSWLTPVPDQPMFAKLIYNSATATAATATAGPLPPSNVDASTQPPSETPALVETLRTVEETPTGRKIIETKTYQDGTQTVTETYEENLDVADEESANIPSQVPAAANEGTPYYDEEEIPVEEEEEEPQISYNNQPKPAAFVQNDQSIEEPEITYNDEPEPPVTQQTTQFSEDVVESVPYNEPRVRSSESEPKTKSRKKTEATSGPPVTNLARSRGADPPGEAKEGQSFIGSHM